MDQNEPSYLLALPAELRLDIYKFLYPIGKRIFLNLKQSQQGSAWDNYLEEDHGVTLSTMLVCKKVHVEVTEFVFSNNRPSILNPLESGLFLDKLGVIAQKFIEWLEVRLTIGIEEIGRAWRTLDQCPRLTRLSLRCFGRRENSLWPRTLAQLTHQVLIQYHLPNDRGDPEARPPAIRLLLYPDRWHSEQAQDVATYTTRLDQSRLWARAHAQMSSFRLPDLVTEIIVVAEGTPNTANALKLHSPSEEFDGWHFIEGTRWTPQDDGWGFRLEKDALAPEMPQT